MSKVLLFISASFLAINIANASPQKEMSGSELLGRKIFEDKNLSEPKGVACASCHESDKAFQGNNGSSIAPLAEGSIKGNFGNRNVPTVSYSAFSPAFHFEKETGEDGVIEYIPTGGQFHDGRAADLSAQVEGPLLNKKEMNNTSKEAVVEKIRNAEYAYLVKQLYGDKIFDDKAKAFESISNAVAAFEGTHAFMSFSSKFDKVLQGKDSFTDIEAEGFKLFKDPKKGNCIGCHVGDEKSNKPSDWLFTDFTYDNLGLPRNMDIPENADTSYYDLGLCKQPDIEKTAPAEVNVEDLCGAFKVPTLRNIALTAPYGHNGVFKDLREIVKFYATRDTSPELWYPKNADGSANKFNDVPEKYKSNVNTSEVPYDKKKGEKPHLNEAEIDALVAFLKTLTDG